MLEHTADRGGLASEGHAHDFADAKGDAVPLPDRQGRTEVGDALSVEEAPANGALCRTLSADRLDRPSLQHAPPGALDCSSALQSSLHSIPGSASAHDEYGQTGQEQAGMEQGSPVSGVAEQPLAMDAVLSVDRAPDAILASSVPSVMTTAERDEQSIVEAADIASDGCLKPHQPASAIEDGPAAPAGEQEGMRLELMPLMAPECETDRAEGESTIPEAPEQPQAMDAAPPIAIVPALCAPSALTPAGDGYDMRVEPGDTDRDEQPERHQPADTSSGGQATPAGEQADIRTQVMHMMAPDRPIALAMQRAAEQLESNAEPKAKPRWGHRSRKGKGDAQRYRWLRVGRTWRKQAA